MHPKYRFLALVSVFLMLCAMFVPAAAAAQAGPMPPAEFREKFTAYMGWLDSNTSRTLKSSTGMGASLNLAEQVRAMSDEEFQALYDSFVDPDAFIAITQQIMAPAGKSQAQPHASISGAQAALAATPLYPPAYPSGSTYDVWVATLPGLGLLSDTNGDGSLADERCSSDGEAGIGIAEGVLVAAAIVGDVACNSIVVVLGEGTNLPACIAAGILHEAVLANDIVAAQTSSQDGFVDSAEIEAAYENSKIIAGQADGIVTQLATHDTDIKNALATHDTDIKNELATHDTDIKNALATHDADMKAALQAHHVAVINLITANQAQSVKIEIEKALADTNDNKRLSYFYLPQAQGGLLETVRQTVLDAMNANLAAGLSIGNAQSWFDKAEASFALGAYKTAYDQYGKAYMEVTK
jgi:hypothetical protein